MINLAGNKVLVVVAHPDDETIGCGGSISRLAGAGNPVRVLLPMRGQLEKTASQWQTRLDKFKTAAHILGAECIIVDEPMDEVLAPQHLHTLVDMLAEQVAWADVVFTHWVNDTHQSHQVLSRAVEIATRPFKTKKHTVLFETPSSTDQGFFQNFCPNFYIGISDEDLRRKKQGMAVYADQYAPGRTPADLEHHARYRGGQIGVSAAEAFYVARSFF